MAEEPMETERRTNEGSGIDLPEDLRVPVGGGKADVPPALSNSKHGNLAGGFRPRRPVLVWPWAILGVVVVALLAVTIYLILGRLNFNRGSIQFAFEPPGVDVVIDGELSKRSVSSLTVKLKAGLHILQATKSGYLDFEREFNLAAGERAAMNVVMEPVPEVTVVAEGEMRFVGVVRSGQRVVYMMPDGQFTAVTAAVPEPEAQLFEGSFAEAQDVVWSPGEPAAIVKLLGKPTLKNMYDNRGVRGRFIPPGERPAQGLPRDNGISTWLFDDARRTASGWQPVLLNESVRDVAFAPDGGRVVYFYETADGEKSLVVAHPDGSEWERLITHIDAIDPQLTWLNDDRYVLLLDDGNLPDRLFDVISKEFIEIMPDRLRQTTVTSSPDGSRILYWIATEGGLRLGVWNLISGTQEQALDEPIRAFVWQTDSRIVAVKEDNSLWYWELTGEERPVQFVSSVGVLTPQRLLYSLLSRELFIVEDSRITKLKT